MECEATVEPPSCRGRTPIRPWLPDPRHDIPRLRNATSVRVAPATPRASRAHPTRRRARGRAPCDDLARRPRRALERPGAWRAPGTAVHRWMREGAGGADPLVGTSRRGASGRPDRIGAGRAPGASDTRSIEALRRPRRPPALTEPAAELEALPGPRERRRPDADLRPRGEPVHRQRWRDGKRPDRNRRQRVVERAHDVRLGQRRDRPRRARPDGHLEGITAARNHERHIERPEVEVDAPVGAQRGHRRQRDAQRRPRVGRRGGAQPGPARSTRRRPPRRPRARRSRPSGALALGRRPTSSASCARPRYRSAGVARRQHGPGRDPVHRHGRAARRRGQGSRAPRPVTRGLWPPRDGTSSCHIPHLIRAASGLQYPVEPERVLPPLAVVVSLALGGNAVGWPRLLALREDPEALRQRVEPRGAALPVTRPIAEPEDQLPARVATRRFISTGRRSATWRSAEVSIGLTRPHPPTPSP